MTIRQLDAAYIRIDTDSSYVLDELTNALTFEVPGAKYLPAVRRGFWNGKVSLLSRRTRKTLAGLRWFIEDWCRGRNIAVTVDAHELETDSLDDFLEHVQSLALPIKPRSYQLEAACHALINKRVILESPTGSGKSLIMYLLASWFVHVGRRVLYIVPTVNLIEQIRSDFVEYGATFELGDLHSSAPFVLATWQSLVRRVDSLDAFDVIMGDECHLFRARSLMKIMTSAKRQHYRIGCTGTLQSERIHRLVLEGLFGQPFTTTKTRELIEQNVLSDLTITAIRLIHKPSDVMNLPRDLHAEYDYLMSHARRNRFLLRLVEACQGNTLILFQFVQKHGFPLYNLFVERFGKSRVYLITGSIESETREAIRKAMQASANAILLASYGTTSTGVNIPNLHNLIFALGFKSRIRNLQSIGRVLRRTDDKTHARVFDIADDFGYYNYSLRHFRTRLKIYRDEGFDVRLVDVPL